MTATERLGKKQTKKTLPFKAAISFAKYIDQKKNTPVFGVTQLYLNSLVKPRILFQVFLRIILSLKSINHQWFTDFGKRYETKSITALRIFLRQ